MEGLKIEFDERIELINRYIKHWINKGEKYE